MEAVHAEARVEVEDILTDDVEARVVHGVALEGVHVRDAVQVAEHGAHIAVDLVNKSRLYSG